MPNFKNSIHSEFENVLDFIPWCKTVEIFERVKGEKNCNEFLKNTFSSLSILKPHSRVWILAYCHCVKKFIISTKMFQFSKSRSCFYCEIYALIKELC